MPKKTFGVFASVFLIFVLLIIGVDFSTTKAVENSSSGTIVGGVIWENTIWSSENSPYIITATVQIPENVTLTVEPGVSISVSSSFSGSNMFLLAGRIIAHGTSDKKITFDGGNKISKFFASVNYYTPGAFLSLQNCKIMNGGSIWWPVAGDYGGCFELKYSEIIGISSYSYIWYPQGDVHIEHNIFINSTGFSVGHSGPSVYIRYNLFKGNRGFVVSNWASYAGQTIVKYNSFINMSGTVLELPYIYIAQQP